MFCNAHPVLKGERNKYSFLYPTRALDIGFDPSLENTFSRNGEKNIIFFPLGRIKLSYKYLS
jgi:hypothetical protein